MSSESLNSVERSLRVKRLLPAAAVVTFITMVAIAEYQIRLSPKWPPPARRKVGGWQIDDPPLWTLAANLNLPATVSIVWMSALSDSFTYALDDHSLIVYVPWTFLVFGLWYFVAHQIERSAQRQVGSGIQRLLVFSTQVLITGELISFGIGIISRSPADHPQDTPIVVVVCFWAWVLAAIMGWVNLVPRPSKKGN